MQLWLLEAACEDTSLVLTQIHEFKSFLTQMTSSSGKGPCSLTQKRANRATQIHTAKAYVVECSNKHAHHEALEEKQIHRYLCHQVVQGTDLQRLRKV